MSNFKQYLRESLHEAMFQQSNTTTGQLGYYNSNTGQWEGSGPDQRGGGNQGGGGIVQDKPGYHKYVNPYDLGEILEVPIDYPGLGPGDEGYYDYSQPGGGPNWNDGGGGMQA